MAEFGNNNVDLDIWVLFHILKDNLAVFEALGFPNSGLTLFRAGPTAVSTVRGGADLPPLGF